jgi:hypothetical protein
MGSVLSSIKKKSARSSESFRFKKGERQSANIGRSFTDENLIRKQEYRPWSHSHSTHAKLNSIHFSDQNRDSYSLKKRNINARRLNSQQADIEIIENSNNSCDELALHSERHINEKVYKTRSLTQIYLGSPSTIKLKIYSKKLKYFNIKNFKLYI